MKKLLRTIQGFIIEPRGKIWRVGLIDGGKVIKYDFSNKKFRHARIRFQNQPFALLEFIENDVKTYEVRPLCKESEMKLVKIPLDKEHEAKLKFIMENWSTTPNSEPGLIKEN